MDNKKYVFEILKIILLTNLPIIIIILPLFSISIGWVLGSIGSAINFYWMFRQVSQMNILDEKINAKNAGFGFLSRFLFIICWSVAVILLIKPNIIAFGLGLLSAQYAIFIHQGILTIKSSKWIKYFRGD